MIQVVMVDDEALVRCGSELILNASDGIQVVAAAEGAQAADAALVAARAGLLGEDGACTARDSGR